MRKQNEYLIIETCNCAVLHTGVYIREDHSSFNHNSNGWWKKKTNVYNNVEFGKKYKLRWTRYCCTMNR